MAVRKVTLFKTGNQNAKKQENQVYAEEERKGPWTCQLWVMECQMPTLPVLLKATSWLPMKNSLSTATDNENTPQNYAQYAREIQRMWAWNPEWKRIPILTCALGPPSTRFHRWMELLERAAANILSELWAPNLVFKAMCLRVASSLGLVYANCHPTLSFILQSLSPNTNHNQHYILRDFIQK